MTPEQIKKIYPYLDVFGCRIRNSIVKDLKRGMDLEGILLGIKNKGLIKQEEVDFVMEIYNGMV